MVAGAEVLGGQVTQFHDSTGVSIAVVGAHLVVCA